MARFDQIFDAIRGMRAALDRLQHSQAQRVAGVGTPVQQVLAHFAQTLKRAEEAYKKATDAAVKAMQAQQTAQARVQSLYNSIVNKIPRGQRNQANINQALGSNPAYQAAQRRAQAAQARMARAQGGAGAAKQRAAAAAQANLDANKRANSVIGKVTSGLDKVATLASGPVGSALSIAAGAARAIAQSFDRMKRQLNSTHQSLTGFNVAIGIAQMRLKIGDVHRQMDFARRIQTGAVAFAESENRARDAFQSANVLSHNAGSALGTAGNNALAQIGEILDPFFKVLNSMLDVVSQIDIAAAINPLVIIAEGARAAVIIMSANIVLIYNGLSDAVLFFTKKAVNMGQMQLPGGNVPAMPRKGGGNVGNAFGHRLERGGH